jgi:hypothetical protein
MIHWIWLIPAAMLGGYIGVCAMALCVVAKRADVAMEESSRTNMNGE